MAEAVPGDYEAMETLSGGDDVVGSGEEQKNFSSQEDSSDSDSDSDSDEEAENVQVDALESAVRENPSDYDAHVRYIQCLRKLGDMEKLRQARKSMNELFPLSAKMWMEWASDEVVLSNSSEAISEVEEIYEKGVHEYLSVPLWLEYIHFVEGHDPLVAQCCSAGVSKMRDLYERAICAAGLHIVEGNRIWDAYREFEEAILIAIDENDSEEKARQVQRICALFHRQLSVPLSDLKATLHAYKSWEDEHSNVNEMNSGELDGIPESVASAYQKALDMYNARISYEDQLSNSDASDSDRLQYFMTYIKFEESSSGNPARVQTLYERAVSEFPISSDLWLGYTNYLDKTLKVPQVLKDAYSRATRNCSWMGALWVQYMLSLERVGASEESLSTVFEQSLQCTFSSFNEYLELFLTRVDGLRRRMSASVAEDSLLNYNLIRDTFQRAAEYLSSETISMDDLIHLHDYWSRLEITLGKDLVAARGVWESLIKKSGQVMEIWKSYIDMEVRLGNIGEARAIYKRCYSKRFIGTGSEDICYSWLQFEREFGALDDYDLALKKVTPRLEELSVYRLQQASKSVTPTTTQKESIIEKPMPKKRKTSSRLSEKQHPMKRHKQGEPKHESHESGTGHVTASPTLSPKPGDFNSAPNDATQAFYTDQCTAFVSNLSHEANENHLREFFSEVGGVTAIRLLRDKFTGRSRGLAYVDFVDDEHLNMAIQNTRAKLFGKKISIKRSDPKQSQKRESGKGDLAGNYGRSGPSSGFRDGNQKADDGNPKNSVTQKRGKHLQLTGTNTFALPRSVRPLGWSRKESTTAEVEDKPKSNEEFRKMLMK